MEPLSKEELILKLKEIQLINDEEYAHQQADDALLAYINDDEITRLFNEIDKWYS